MIERDKEKVLAVTEVKSDNFEVKENKLRPSLLDEFIGQNELKASLRISIEAARSRAESLDHTLFHGPPGLGKTTLANIIAKEMGVLVKSTSGPAIERQGDLAAILSNLSEGDILFVDEIHRLRPQVEEILYSAMEDFAIDIVLGQGASARSMRLAIPSFTLIGATTKLSSLSSPLRDRFGNLLKLNHYDTDDLTKIVVRAAKILGVEVEAKAASRIASSSRFTPRIANRLLKRVRDYAVVADECQINLDLAVKALSDLGIDAIGLDHVDRKILRSICEQFQGGPVGVSTLAALVAEEESTLEEVYEPYLMRLGLLERTHRGRCVTQKAFEHLGLEAIGK